MYLSKPQGSSPSQGYHSCSSLELLWWKKEEDEEEVLKQEKKPDIQPSETRTCSMGATRTHQKKKVRQKTPTLRCQTLSAFGGYYRTNYRTNCKSGRGVLYVSPVLSVCQYGLSGPDQNLDAVHLFLNQYNHFFNG